MRVGTIIGAIVAVVVVAGGAYAIHSLSPPSQTAIEEGNALTLANNKMMTGMMGSGVTYSGDPDRDFVMLMIPHHQGAIDMANVELKYGTDPTMRALAQKIATGQQPEIDQMNAWQKTHAIAASVDLGVEQAAYLAANDAMMNGMMGDSMAHSGNADVDFAKMMVPHHQGAIDMAAIELKYGTDTATRTLAQSIAAAQTGEIAAMNSWLKAGGH